MATKDKNDKRVKPKPAPVSSYDDPFREESTDFRAPGEKFEIMPEGENLDLRMMDQPRRNLESLPKAYKQKTRAPAPGAGGKSKKKDRAA